MVKSACCRGGTRIADGNFVTADERMIELSHNSSIHRDRAKSQEVFCRSSLDCKRIKQKYQERLGDCDGNALRLGQLFAWKACRIDAALRLDRNFSWITWRRVSLWFATSKGKTSLSGDFSHFVALMRESKHM